MRFVGFDQLGWFLVRKWSKKTSNFEIFQQDMVLKEGDGFVLVGRCVSSLLDFEVVKWQKGQNRN